MLKVNKEIFDVCVIGGGPAGMMAAGRAAESGKKVVLLEKNCCLGKKLLITGNGRSNITNAEFNHKELAKKYGRSGDFFLSPLSVFGPKEIIDFFEKRGLKTKIEKEKRVFPENDNAESVLNVLINYLREGKVEILTDSEVLDVLKEKNRISKIILKNGGEITAGNYIICTGGKSHSETGSAGDGYKWVRNLGHTVSELRPALVPLNIKEAWPKEAQGLSLENAELAVFQNGKIKERRTGELLFTHFGISGPVVLNLSSKVGELLEKGEVKIFLDLNPDLDIQALDKIIQSDFSKNQKRLFKNYLSDVLSQKLVEVILGLLKMDPLTEVNQITREERHALVGLLKKLEMTVDSLLGFEVAITVSGGISLKEIDSKTMKSKLIENLFFAGEIIDLHGPSGGYNLQFCWSTGYLAGKSASLLKE